MICRRRTLSYSILVLPLSVSLSLCLVVNRLLLYVAPSIKITIIYIMSSENVIDIQLVKL